MTLSLQLIVSKNPMKYLSFHFQMIQLKNFWMTLIETAVMMPSVNTAGKDTVIISTCKINPSNITFRELSDGNLSDKVAEERKDDNLIAQMGYLLLLRGY
jgi:hypothetical protein